MRRDIEYAKKSTKKNRQELLNKALGECMLELRKKFYPYQRHGFLWDDITIEERDLINAYGQYTWDKKEYVHRIYINSDEIRHAQKNKDWWLRGHFFEQIKRTIIHELIHAFVQEKWEWRFSSITEKNCDASPIFLTILYWAGGTTNHDCLKGFKKTELYKKVVKEYNFLTHKIESKGFKTYRELELYLIDYLQEYFLEIQRIADINNYEELNANKTKDGFSIKNTFTFSPRKNGMKKYIESYNKDIVKTVEGDYKIIKCISTIWQIGCNIEPNMIVDLYNKKRHSKAEYIDKRVNLIIGDKDKMKANIKLEPDDIRIIEVKKESNFK